MIINDFKIFLKAFFEILSQLIVEIAISIFKIFRRYPFAYTAIAYLFITMAFCYYPIFDHWIAGFIMMSLPLAILFGLTAACFLLIKKQKIVAATGFIYISFGKKSGWGWKWRSQAE